MFQNILLYDIKSHIAGSSCHLGSVIAILMQIYFVATCWDLWRVYGNAIFITMFIVI